MDLLEEYIDSDDDSLDASDSVKDFFAAYAEANQKNLIFGTSEEELQKLDEPILPTVLKTVRNLVKEVNEYKEENVNITNDMSIDRFKIKRGYESLGEELKMVNWNYGTVKDLLLDVLEEVMKVKAEMEELKLKMEMNATKDDECDGKRKARVSPESVKKAQIKKRNSTDADSTGNQTLTQMGCVFKKKKDMEDTKV